MSKEELDDPYFEIEVIVYRWTDVVQWLALFGIILFYFAKRRCGIALLCTEYR